jgi:hypothetical protein
MKCQSAEDGRREQMSGTEETVIALDCILLSHKHIHTTDPPQDYRDRARTSRRRLYQDALE